MAQLEVIDRNLKKKDLWKKVYNQYLYDQIHDVKVEKGGSIK